MMVNEVLFNAKVLADNTGERLLPGYGVVRKCMANPTLRQAGKRLFGWFGSQKYDPRIGSISNSNMAVRIGLVSWALDNLGMNHEIS